MANTRRAANRGGAGKRGHAEVDYSAYDARTKTRNGSHGSPRESESRGPGEYAGAGELTIGHGPGKMAREVKPQMSGLPFQGGANSFTPKGLKVDPEGT